MSLIEAAERFAAMDRSAVVLDAKQCLHSQARKAACEACFAVCPCEAITPGKPPILDAAKCGTCLACLTVCPTGAYSADDAVPALLRVVPHLDDHSVELVCGQNPAPARGSSEHGAVVLIKGCLGGLGTGAYLALAALGVEHVAVRTEACAACEWAHLQPHIQTDLEHARQLLAAWDKSEVVAACPEPGTHTLTVWSSANPPLSRRDLFRMVAQQGQVALARAMENGVRAGGRRPGRERLRTVAAINHMPAPEREPAIGLRELGFASLTVSEACTACGACAKVCPTTALTFEKDDDNTRFALKFRADYCIACDLCTNVCLPEALALGEPVGLAAACSPEAVTVLEGELVKCQRCGAMMAKSGERELCDVCGYRRAHPFGSKMPAGLRRSTSGPGENQQ